MAVDAFLTVTNTIRDLPVEPIIGSTAYCMDTRSIMMYDTNEKWITAVAVDDCSQDIKRLKIECSYCTMLTVTDANNPVTRCDSCGAGFTSEDFAKAGYLHND